MGGSTIEVPWAQPYVDVAELDAVKAVVESGWLSMGEKVRQLEQVWAAHLGARYAIAVANGTLALELALRASRIGPGDEVVVPAMTYIATVNAVVLCGARPIFADIEDQTYNLNPEDIAPRITRKTRAIVYIDYGGNPADADGIAAVGKEYGILVLQDAAQSLGGMQRGRPCGFDTGLSTTSFHIAKLVTTIEGGMVFTDDENLAQQLRLLRNQGEDPQRKYYHVAIGHNARMTDLQAAIGLAQFKKFPQILARRLELAMNYYQLLGGYPRIKLVPKRRGKDQNGMFFFPVLIPNRDQVAEKLREEGIDTRIAYPLPVYRQPAYQGLLPTDFVPNCPVAEEFTQRVLNLPMFHQMTRGQQEMVTSRLQKLV